MFAYIRNQHYCIVKLFIKLLNILDLLLQYLILELCMGIYSWHFSNLFTELLQCILGLTCPWHVQEHCLGKSLTSRTVVASEACLKVFYVFFYRSVCHPSPSIAISWCSVSLIEHVQMAFVESWKFWEVTYCNFLIVGICRCSVS